MSEEMFEALLEVVEACIEAKDRASGIEEANRYRQLQQDFIDEFITE